MAKYDHLPIYKHSMELIIHLEKHIKNMSRSNQYGFGGEMRKKSFKILSFIIRANSTQDRKNILLELRIHLEELKQFFLIGKEIQVFHSFGAFQEVMLKLENIIKQNEGWIRSTTKKS